MRIYFDILLIGCIYVFGLDVCRFWEVLSSKIKWLLTKGAASTPFPLKPFSCSLCMTFWTGIAYLAVVGALSIANVAYVCLVAMLTPRICDVLLALDNILANLLNKIYTWNNRD